MFISNDSPKLNTNYWKLNTNYSMNTNYYDSQAESAAIPLLDTQLISMLCFSQQREPVL